MLGWSDQIAVKQTITCDFCMEMEIEEVGKQETYWGIFVYTSADKKTRNAQWQYLIQQQDKWQNLWFLGGDLNDI